MLHSNGVIISNKIQDNEGVGISLVSHTFARIEGNLIENNRLHGVEIKDPSHPVLINNKIQGNTYQLGLDKKIRSQWDTYKNLNPGIIGENDFPQGF